MHPNKDSFDSFKLLLSLADQFCKPRWIPVILLVVWLQAGATVLGQDTFYAAVKALQNTTDEAGWRRLEKPLAELRKTIEKQAGHLPYENSGEIATLDSLRGIANAQPGSHTLWRQFRIASQTAPTKGYINQCAAVLHADLRADEKSPESMRKPKDRRTRWDGYIVSSVVIVDGAIDMDGQISNSIVICSGPAKIHSYIANSFVVSCYTGDEFSVDTHDGYISNSIVVAKRCRPNSARNSVIFGEVEGTDMRGADAKPWNMVSQLIESLGVPARDYSQPVSPVASGPNVAQKLAALLATEDQIKAGMLAEELSDAILTKEQVDSLIENATSTSSDSRRNALWHTIRLSRDIGGQQYLRETLSKKATSEQRIRFIQSMKNPTIDDVPLIADMYEASQQAEAEDGPKSKSTKTHDNVSEQILRVACIDWKRMVPDTSRNPDLDQDEATLQRKIYDRRQDRALEGQANLLRWLVRNGATDEHRLQAFSAVRIVTSWPNEWKWVEQTSLDDDLLASSQDPAFRVKVIDKFGSSIQLARFLDPELGHVDAVRLAAVRAIRRSILLEQQAAVGYSGQYTQLLKRVSQFDEASSVRQAASQVLEEFTAR